MAEKAAQALHDGEAEAEPGPARSDTGDLIEFAEDVLPLTSRDADAGVRHLDSQPIAAAAGTDHDAAALRIAHRVGNQIEQDALQQEAIAAHPGGAGQDAQTQRFRAGIGGEHILQLAQQRIDRKRGDVGLDGAGIELGDVEQRVEQLVHRGDRRADPGDDPTPIGAGGVGIELGDEQTKRVQRLPQVVARRRQETRLGEIGELELPRALDHLALERRVGLLQLRRHAVELISQRLQLVAGRDVDAVIERARADPGGARLQGPDRPYHLPGEQEAQQHRKTESPRSKAPRRLSDT